MTCLKKAGSSWFGPYTLSRVIFLSLVYSIKRLQGSEYCLIKSKLKILLNRKQTPTFWLEKALKMAL